MNQSKRNDFVVKSIFAFVYAFNFYPNHASTVIRLKEINLKQLYIFASQSSFYLIGICTKRNHLTFCHIGKAISLSKKLIGFVIICKEQKQKERNTG